MSRRRRLLLGVACSGVATLAGGIHPARAHAALVRSEPSRRAVLTEPPKQVRLWFNEPVEPDYSSISLLDAAEHLVPTGQAKTSPGDGKLLILDLPPLAPGRYTVRYRVNSIDGHIVEASFDFSLEAATGGK